MTKSWNTSCLDWEKRIINGESLIPFDPLFPEYAEQALNIFKSLRIVDLPGHPTFGEVSLPWVFDLIKAIFGSYDQNSGRMLIREFFLFVSKKNGKSCLASAIMLTSLILNWRDSAEFIILAPTVKVAGNSFEPAMGMCREDIDPQLSDLMHVQSHYKKITNLNTNAVLNVVAADSATVSGIKATSVFIDELHEFGKSAKAEGMILEATGGLMSRPEGFIVWATTQSDEPPAGILEKKLRYARNVRDGVIEDNTFLPILYEFPQDYIDNKKYLDPEYFYITNPNLGRSADEAEILRKYKIAQDEGEDSVQKFTAKHLNVQLGLVLKSKRWAGADFWAESAGEVTIDMILEQCEVIVAGVDGGGLDDLLGLAILGRVSSSGDWMLWNRAWCHPIALERRKSEAPRYKNFEKDGDLIIAEVGEDIAQACEIIGRCDKAGLLDRIGVDPSGIGEIVDELVLTHEIEHERIVGIPQGWRLNGAIKTAERKVAEGSIIHANQPLMAWCVGNARVEPRGNAILITKQASGTGKIDPLMATMNAIALMAMNPEARSQRSVYEGLTKEQIMERMKI